MWRERPRRSRVLGEFPDEDEDALTSRELIDASHGRWVEREPRHPLVLGVDVATSGPDRTVVAIRDGGVVCGFREFRLTDTQDTAGRVA